MGLTLPDIAFACVINGISQFVSDGKKAETTTGNVTKSVVGAAAAFDLLQPVIQKFSGAITGYNVTMGAMSTATKAGGTVLSGLGQVMGGVVALANAFSPSFKAMSTAVTTAMDGAKAAATTFGAVITESLGKALGPLKQIAAGLGTILSGLFELAGAFAQAFLGIGLVIFNAATELGRFIMSVQKTVDDTGDLAESLGTTTGEVAALTAAFASVNISGDKMGTMLARLTTKAVDEFDKGIEKSTKGLETHRASMDKIVDAETSYKRAVQDAGEALAAAREQFAGHAQTIQATESIRKAESVYAKTTARAYEDYAKTVNRAGVDQRELAKSATEAVGPLAKLGISAKDSTGHFRSAPDLFRAVADKIAAIESPAKKADIAIELFGKSGARLLPILNQGGKGLDTFAREMEILGLNFTKFDTDAAGAVETALAKLGLLLDGIKVTLGKPLLDDFAKLLNYVYTLGVNSLKAATDIGLVSTAVGWLREPLVAASGGLAAVTEHVNKTSGALAGGGVGTATPTSGHLYSMMEKVGGKATVLGGILTKKLSPEVKAAGDKVWDLARAHTGAAQAVGEQTNAMDPLARTYESAKQKINQIIEAWTRSKAAGESFDKFIGGVVKQWGVSGATWETVVKTFNSFKDATISLIKALPQMGDAFMAILGVITKIGPPILSFLTTMSTGFTTFIGWVETAISNAARLYEMATRLETVKNRLAGGSGGTGGLAGQRPIDNAISELMAGSTLLPLQTAEALDLARNRAATITNSLTGALTGFGGVTLPIVSRVPGGTFQSSTGNGAPQVALSFAGDFHQYNGGGGGDGGMSVPLFASLYREAKQRGAI